MSIYAGLDVGDKSTHVCLVDAEGTVLRRDALASDPEVLAKWFSKHCPDLERVVLETGGLSTFLYHGLVERHVPAECICARHAKGILSARVNKSDVHDAEGLAQLARTGWFKRVHMKASATHIDRAALRIRMQLVATRIAMANQLRGLLKLFGLRMGKVTTAGKRRSAWLRCSVSAPTWKRCSCRSSNPSRHSKRSYVRPVSCSSGGLRTIRSVSAL